MSEVVKPPAVSVTVATLNRPVLVRETLLSIKRQSFTDFECTVIDDGSNAATRDAYARWWPDLDERFRLVLQPLPDYPGSSPAASRNRGYRAARGEFLAFCDDDDYWHDPDFLAVGVRMLREHNADFFMGNMRGEKAGVVTLADWFRGSPDLTRGPCVSDSPVVHELRLDDAMRAMWHHRPHPNSWVVRKTLMDRVGGFWELDHFCEDFELMLRLADASERMLYRPDPVASYNLTPRVSSFSRGRRQDQWIQCVFAAQHIRLHAKHPSVRRAGRAFEGWAHRLIAAFLNREGRRGAALSFAWQAFATWPTLGAAISLVQILLGMRVSEPDWLREDSATRDPRGDPPNAIA
jgi:glycosyltransferase involved in cell wall biosynthesis